MRRIVILALLLATFALVCGCETSSDSSLTLPQGTGGGDKPSGVGMSGGGETSSGSGTSGGGETSSGSGTSGGGETSSGSGASSSGDTSGGSGITGSLPNRPDIPRGQAVYGRLVTVPTMVLFEPNEKATILEIRDLLEKQGLTVSESGDMIIWPPVEASGWVVKLGQQSQACDANGRFSLTAPADQSLLGSVTHPTDLGITSPTFDIRSLSTDSSKPKTLVIPMAFAGPCGMSPDDDEFCALTPVATSARSSVLARFMPVDWVQPRGPRIPSFGVRRTSLGTYPPPTEYITNACPDTDGPRNDLPYPAPYFGSTCMLNVLDGACPNENPLSDQQYQKFAFDHGVGDGTLTLGQGYFGEEFQALLGIKFDFQSEFLTPPQKTGLFDGNCPLMHQGRTCGMFFLGDVALYIDEDVHAGEVKTFGVAPGQKGTITVHNNGVFGITDVRSEGSLVELFNPNFFSKAEGVRGLRHFRIEAPSPIPPIYEADQKVDFEVSPEAKGGESATFTFTVDNRIVTLTFEVNKVNIEPSSAILGKNDSQTFEVKVDAAPGADLTYEWDLDSDTGALSSLNGASTTYTVRDITLPPATDVLTAKVYRRDASGKKLLAGKARATISIVERGVRIRPGSALLAPDDTFEFESESIGLPQNAVVSYAWEALDHHGALSSSSGPRVSYQAQSTDVELTDRLKLTIKVSQNGKQTTFGTATAPITIRPEEDGCEIPGPLIIGEHGLGLTLSDNRLDIGDEFIITVTVPDAKKTYSFGTNGAGIITINGFPYPPPGNFSDNSVDLGPWKGGIGAGNVENMPGSTAYEIVAVAKEAFDGGCPYITYTNGLSIWGPSAFVAIDWEHSIYQFFSVRPEESEDP